MSIEKVSSIIQPKPINTLAMKNLQGKQFFN